MTLANLDQALRDIWEKTVEEQPGRFLVDDVIIEAMRRAYRLAESKEEMMKMIGEPPLRGLKEGGE